MTLSPPPLPPTLALDVGSFMVGSAIAVVSWLIMGTIGFSPWAAKPGTDALAMLAVLIIVLQVGSLSFLASASRVAWPDRMGALTTSAVVGFGASTMYALRLADRWAHYFQFIFTCLSGIYLGILAEMVTGVFGGVEGAIARAAMHPAARVRQ